MEEHNGREDNLKRTVVWKGLVVAIARSTGGTRGIRNRSK